MAGLFDDLVPTQAAPQQAPAGGPVLPPPGPDPLGHTYLGGDPTQGSSYSTPEQDRSAAPPAAAAGGLFDDLLPQAATPQAAPPSLLDEAGQGFMQPLQAFGHEFMQQVRGAGAEARAGAPTSLGEAMQRGVSDFAAIPRLASSALGIASAPAQAVVHPIAGAISRALPLPQATRTQMQGGIPHTYNAGQMSQPQAQAAVEDGINTALQAARPATPKGVPMTAPAPMSLEQVEAAKKAAYAKVDASGFKFPQTDVQTLASDIAQEVAKKGGPSGAKLYPASNAMADRITALADQPGGVPLTELDALRSDIYDALVKPGDREAPIGSMMRQKIDALIDNANAPDIRNARDLNTRYSKMKAVTDKLDSAGLRSASTYSGGNYNNAVRQSLRPLVDPTSAQQIRNLTPGENQALRQAVTGTPVQNATRGAAKLLTNKIVQVPFGVLTHGVANAVMEGAGSVLNKAGQKQTGNAVQKVLDLMSAGGHAPPKLAPISPTLALGGRPAPPILSVPGLTGVAVVAAPLAHQPGPAAPKRPIRRTAGSAR